MKHRVPTLSPLAVLMPLLLLNRGGVRPQPGHVRQRSLRHPNVCHRHPRLPPILGCCARAPSTSPGSDLQIQLVSVFASKGRGRGRLCRFC